ncbi:hypothetical protein [Xenorhabdus griffiniae]|uniref:Uncharacterized protein n=1 Tax=Xenorhabdus griffiniae TaxID=351672 RepID=A0ABY9XDI4_9GAMM|nr:hypothetical protein [Xenorhabdus griffiniae]MBD1229497.1 hypothetical protein [Xenorhabdus griffiniae]MBE8589301.1 hypothetical protein [Xenorhabdus griffiniae]WMV70969.1 hypothetical protein QL128_12235 [Xenorhabdus griffiniae]WNH00645.1 hypothetical protein QL112_012240 [Xenorhabdus griffiniae]
MPQSTFTIDIKYNTEALSQLESQLEHIAELMERIHGRHEVGTQQMEKQFGIAGKIFVKSPTIDSAKINQARDEHLRQIVREEIRQFVVRESERGGLFSRW